jgi:hypothetical protein
MDEHMTHFTSADRRHPVNRYARGWTVERPMRGAVALVACLLAGLFPPARALADPGGQAAGPASPESIAERVQGAFASLKSLQVKWENKSEALLDLPEKDAIRFALYHRDEFAIAGDKVFRHWVHYRATGDPMSRDEMKYLIDGGIRKSQSIDYENPKKPKVHNFEILRGTDEVLATTHQVNVYMECIGTPYYDGNYLDVWRRHALHEKTRAGGVNATHPFSLVGALRSGKYTVRSDEEVVNGTPCLVVELPGMDKLWLDAGRGFALVQREWNWGVGMPVMMRFNNSSFQQVVPGLWLPKVTVRELLAAPKYAEHAGLVQVRNTCTVTELRVNDVPDSVFSLEPHPDGLIIDNTKLKDPAPNDMLVYQAGTTPEMTQMSLDAAVAEVAHRKHQAWYTGLIILANLALVAAIVGFFLVRWRLRKARG